MTMPSIRTALGRSRWRVVALLAVVVGAVPIVAGANQLDLHVDGDTIEVVSFEETVADVLDDEGVELAAGDEVLPAPGTPVDGLTAITVLRTIDVTLVVDGVATQHRGTWRTVEGMLDELGVEVAPEQVLRPGPRTVLQDEDRVSLVSPRTVTVATAAADGTVAPDATRTVRTHLTTVGQLIDSLGVEVAANQRVRPRRRAQVTDGLEVVVETARRVQVVADGGRRRTASFAPTVGALLDQIDLEVAQRDRVEPGLDTAVTDGLEVVVRRVTFDRVTEEVAVSFDEQTRPTADLFEGEQRVVREGQEGRAVETYRVRLVDGQPDGHRNRLRSEVVEEPLDRIVEIGTTPAPAPPPSSSSGSGVWYDLAQCESGGRWDYNGSSGYDGGLQFHPDTWRASKPAGYPEYAWQASAGQQIEVGKIVQGHSGWGAWPSCASKLGLL